MLQKTFWLLLIGLFILTLWGCDSHSSKTSKPVDNGEYNFGKSVSKAIKTYLKAGENSEEQLAHYSNHEAKIIEALNAVVVTTPAQKVKGTEPNEDILKALFDLVRDNTLPQLTNALGKLLKTIGEDSNTVSALTALCNTKTGMDSENIIAMLHKLLEYPKSDELWKAIATLLEKNPDLLKEICRLVHHVLINLDPEASAEVFAFLCKEVTQLSMDLGRPAWSVRLDSKDNPQVRKTQDGIFAPFVDSDADGVCDTNASGKPIDAAGNVLDIAAFSDKEYKDGEGKILIQRDSFRRAISPEGQWIFEYYDAKKSILAIFLFAIGQAFSSNLPEDLLSFASEALKPMATYTDSQGSYEGYSQNSHLAKALDGILSLLKDEKVRCLLAGFSKMFQEQEASTVETAFISMGGLFWKEWRDNPNIQDQESLQKWFEEFPNNPPQDIFPMLELMAVTQLEDMPYDNMAMLFFYWISSEYPQISEKVWPLIQALRNVKDAYPIDPTLEERLYENTVHWLQWAVVHRVQSTENDTIVEKPILSIVLDDFVAWLSLDPENNVVLMQDAVKQVISSRVLADLIRYLHNFVDYPIFKEAILHYTAPQENAAVDAYTEIVRVHIGLMECRNSIGTKVELFKLLAKFLDPDLDIMVNLLNAMNRLALADQNFAFLKIARNLVAPLASQETPLAIFGRAYLEVSCLNENIIDGEIENKHIIQMFANLNDFLLNPTGLLQRVYDVIQKKPR